MTFVQSSFLAPVHKKARFGNWIRKGLRVSCCLSGLILAGCVGGSSSSGGAAGDASSTNDSNSSTSQPTDNTVQSALPTRNYPLQPLSCDISDMRQWVDANMRDYYLFYDQVPVVSLEGYSDLQTLIDDLQVKPFDRFSYITDAAASSAFFDEGQLFGFGWRLLRTSQSDVRFAFVYPRSPVAEQNVQRGDFLLAINGVNPLDMTAAQWDSFLGTGDDVVTVQLTVLDTTGETRTVAVTKETFPLDTVLDASVLPVGSNKVGYLAFTSFLETSNAELDEAFDSFREQQVTDLVLDMRYNGGGRISVANKLASKIAGPSFAGDVFAEISWNDKYSDFNEPFNMVVEDNALSLSRVIVLSTDDTCSASEMIINGLKPFVEVVQIGGTTCGKPYGSAPHEACGKAMNALRIRFVNANGVGDYFEGIPANCAAGDNVDFALGNPNESMLQAALDYVDTGSCQTSIASTVTTQQNFTGRVLSQQESNSRYKQDDLLNSEKIIH